MAITLDDVVTRVREDVNDTASPYTYSDTFLKNKILSGVRYLRDVYPEGCEGWFISDTVDFNQTVTGDLQTDNYLQTLSLAGQVMVAKSQRFEDQNNSVYIQDISGTMDTRDITKTRKFVITELESDLAQNMASIHDVYDRPSRGSIGLDALSSEV